MPSLRGSLVRVTASPSTAVGVLVRAPEVRAGRGGLVLTEETQIAVDRGEFTVELEPGPAVLTVQHAGYPGEVIPLMVTEGQTNIAEAMKYAAIADSAEKSEIEELLAAVKAQASAAHDAATKAEDHRVKAYKFTEVTKQYRDQAEAAKDTATTKADEAAESKRRAWQFFSSAQNFSDKAAEFKDQAEAAKDRAVSAKNSAETAKARAESARTRAEQAKTGAESAKNSAETAKARAESARTRAEQAKTGAESAKAGAVAAQRAVESAAESAAQASGKPSGGWLKSDFEQSVQDTLTDVTDAVSSSASSSSGKIARYNRYRAAIYVTDPKISTETANKRYVDGEVQSVTAQLNAAKDELSAGIAAASFITGIFYMQNYGGEVAKKALGSAVECVKETNSGYLVRKEVDALVLTLTETSKSVRFRRVSEYETVSASPGAIAIYFIIGQPQD